MNVLVTGATGFVGGHLVDRLLERGDCVTALVRTPARASNLASRGVRLVPGDLHAHDALAAATQGQDVIYHVAAALGASTEAALMAANRDGTVNLLQSRRDPSAQPRIVLVSSMAAGGPSRRGVPKSDTSDDRPVTMYGRSKLAAEHAVAASGLPWTIIRPPVVYGPRDREGFLPLFRAAKLGIAPMFGDGSMEISLVHVGDLVRAIELAGTVAATVDGVYYVNHPEVVTGKQLIAAIARTMQRRAVPVPIPRWMARVILGMTGMWAEVFRQKSILHPDKIHEFYQEGWAADPSAFIATTGWKPEWDLEHGLADTAAWYRVNRWL
jgi:dihydroflavonol-4-reductase